MKNYICLLRGINVSGQKKIKMEDLRKLFESNGFENVQSYVQSGNVLFHSNLKDVNKITFGIQQTIENKYNFFVPALVKTPEDFKMVLNNNPFSGKKFDQKSLYVIFLFDNPEQDNLQKLSVIKNDEEDFRIIDDIIYIYCPNGYGRSKLNSNIFEKKLKVPATTRNWNTVNQLYKLTWN